MNIENVTGEEIAAAHEIVAVLLKSSASARQIVSTIDALEPYLKGNDVQALLKTLAHRAEVYLEDESSFAALGNLFARVAGTLLSQQPNETRQAIHVINETLARTEIKIRSRGVVMRRKSNGVAP